MYNTELRLYNTQLRTVVRRTARRQRKRAAPSLDRQREPRLNLCGSFVVMG